MSHDAPGGLASVPSSKARLVAALVCPVLLASLVGCVPEPEPPTFGSDLLAPIVDYGGSQWLGITDEVFIRWFDSYCLARIREVPLTGREPMSFGPWSAMEDYGTEDADSDGRLTEWADHYYITHDWSDYGTQILSMEPGDAVQVNEDAIVVERVFDYPKDSYYEEVMRIIGSDAVVFQTCYPDSDYNRIVYGR